MKDYRVVKRERELYKNFKLIPISEYHVICSKILGLGGVGIKTVAVFNCEEDANRYADELNYIQEQRRAEYERNKQDRKPKSYDRKHWENHVAECCSDWNVDHGYRY